MTQNLNIKIQDAYCYKDKDENCQKYGRLYTLGKQLKKDADYWGMVGDCQQMPSGRNWLKVMGDFMIGMYTGILETQNSLIENYLSMALVGLRPF